MLDCALSLAPASCDRAKGTANCLPVKSQAAKLGDMRKQCFVGRMATVAQNSVHTSRLSADLGMHALRDEIQNTQMTDPASHFDLGYSIHQEVEAVRQIVLKMPDLRRW